MLDRQREDLVGEDVGGASAGLDGLDVALRVEVQERGGLHGRGGAGGQEGAVRSNAPAAAGPAHALEEASRRRTQGGNGGEKPGSHTGEIRQIIETKLGKKRRAGVNRTCVGSVHATFRVARAK